MEMNGGSIVVVHTILSHFETFLTKDLFRKEMFQGSNSTAREI